MAKLSDKNKMNLDLSLVKERLSKVAPQREMVLWILVMLALLFFGFQRLVTPASTQVDALKAKIEKERVQLGFQQKMAKDLIGAKGVSPNKRMAGLQKKVNKIFKKTPTSPDVMISEIMAHLTDAKYRKLVHMTSFRVKKEVEKKGYKEIHFEFDIIGRYSDMAKYLKMFHSLPYLMGTKEIFIKPHKEEGTGRVEVIAKNVLFVSDKPVPSTARKGDGKSVKGPTAGKLLTSLHSLKPSRSPFRSKKRNPANWSLYDLNLTGVISGTRRPSALINGKVFELGDNVAGYKIVKIYPNEIILKKGPREHRLKLSELEAQGVEVTRERRSGKTPDEKPDQAEEEIARDEVEEREGLAMETDRELDEEELEEIQIEERFLREEEGQTLEESSFD